MAGSSVKAVVKRALSSPEMREEIDNEQAAVLANRTLQDHRLHVLKR